MCPSAVYKVYLIPLPLPSPSPSPLSVQGLVYLIQVSHVEEKEIFKICLEYWNSLTADLYRENPIPWATRSLLIVENGQTPRRELYQEVLSEVGVGGMR